MNHLKYRLCAFASLFVFYVSTTAGAKDEKKLPFSLHAFRVDEKYLEFFEINNLGITISKKCLDVKNIPNEKNFSEKKWQDKCLAYKAIEQAKKLSVDSTLLTGGKDPGAVACKTSLGGKVLFAEVVDEKPEFGSYQTLCAFSDGSMVTVNSLNTYLASSLVPEVKSDDKEANKSKSKKLKKSNKVK